MAAVEVDNLIYSPATTLGKSKYNPEFYIAENIIAKVGNTGDFSQGTYCVIASNQEHTREFQKVASFFDRKRHFVKRKKVSSWFVTSPFMVEG